MNHYEAVVVGYDHSNVLSVIRGLGRQNKNFYAVIVYEGVPKICVKSKYLKAYIFCKESEILENLCRIGKNLKDNIPLICCDDPSAYIIDKNLNTLAQYFYCPSINMCQGKICQMMDKYEQYLFARMYDIAMAETFVISLDKISNVTYSYPLILKPRFSVDGDKSDICKVTDEEELYQALRNFQDKGYRDILAQDYIDIDCEILFYGVILGAGSYTCNGVRKILRWPRVGGSTVFSVTVEPSGFIKKILHHLGDMGYVGMYDIEVYRKDGKYILNEINFRHTGLGYVELSNGVNSGCDLIDFFNRHKVNKAKASKKIYSVNSRQLIDMMRAGEVSVLDFLKIELISRSHSLFTWDDPMPVFHVIAVKCQKTVRGMINKYRLTGILK